MLLDLCRSYPHADQKAVFAQQQLLKNSFSGSRISCLVFYGTQIGNAFRKKFSGESACGIASISSLRHSVPQKILGTVADGRLALWIDANFAEIAEFAKSVHTGTLQLEKKAVYYR